jgi:hypothetical protein
VPYANLSNARPATLALSNPPAEFDDLPFDPLEFIDHLDQLPYELGEPGYGE